MRRVYAVLLLVCLSLGSCDAVRNKYTYPGSARTLMATLDFEDPIFEACLAFWLTKDRWEKLSAFSDREYTQSWLWQLTAEETRRLQAATAATAAAAAAGASSSNEKTLYAATLTPEVILGHCARWFLQVCGMSRRLQVLLASLQGSSSAGCATLSALLLVQSSHIWEVQVIRFLQARLPGAELPMLEGLTHQNRPMIFPMNPRFLHDMGSLGGQTVVQLHGQGVCWFHVYYHEYLNSSVVTAQPLDRRWGLDVWDHYPETPYLGQVSLFRSCGSCRSHQALTSASCFLQKCTGPAAHALFADCNLAPASLLRHKSACPWQGSCRTDYGVMCRRCGFTR